ncbi:MAG TPA: hypothetical protein VLH16_02785 [Bacteroidales bacterium]|nr:hypothetical protein [Bacteroidales bacterium]
MKPNIRKTDVYVNGIILTPEAINAIYFLQTGGTLNFKEEPDRNFDNGGLKSVVEDIDELHNYFVKRVIDDDYEDLRLNRDMLSNVNSFRYWFNMFAAPVE